MEKGNGNSGLYVTTEAECKAIATDLRALTVKIFADGADRRGMLELARNPLIRGFTTNPTLMRKAGVTDYGAFCRDVLAAIPDRPISFEVLCDDMGEMRRQAERIAGWGTNAYVKIPITDTQGRSCTPLVSRLSRDGIKVNVTAMMTLRQVAQVAEAVAGGAPAYVSIFAGRLADVGVDPVPVMSRALELLRPAPNAELLWASCREILNILQADRIGCPVITVTHALLAKLPLIGKDPRAYSLETVKMFFNDACQAGYTLRGGQGSTAERDGVDEDAIIEGRRRE